MTDPLDLADELGPIDYALIEFPGDRFDGTLAPALVDLVDAGLIHLLDVVFVHKAADGTIDVVELHDAGPDEAGTLAGVECDLPGLTTDADLEAVAAALEPGTSAGLFVWENLWAAPFSAAVRRLGGQLVASGRIPVSDLLTSIEAADGGEEDTQP